MDTRDGAVGTRVAGNVKEEPNDVIVRAQTPGRKTEDETAVVRNPEYKQDFVTHNDAQVLNLSPHLV